MARHAAILHLRRSVLCFCQLELFFDIAVTNQAECAPRSIEQLNLSFDCRCMTRVAPGGKRCVDKAVQEFRGIRAVRVMAFGAVGFLNRLILVGLSQRGDIPTVTFQTERRRSFVQMENSFGLASRLAFVSGVTCRTAHIYGRMLRRFFQECFNLGVACEAEVTSMVAAFGSTLQQTWCCGTVRIVTRATRFLTESKMKGGLCGLGPLVIVTLVTKLVAFGTEINVSFVLIAFNGVASITAQLHGRVHRGSLELRFMALLATIEVESVPVSRAGDSRMWSLRQPMMDENG